MSPTRKSGGSTRGKGSKVLSDAELAAMRETISERTRARSGGAAGEADLLAKIAEMPEPDRVMAERIHAIVKANAPNLSPRTWYGMPAYEKDGNVICFFQSAHKFKSRYATFGFDQAATLDDGDMWATGFALKKLTADIEQRIAALVRRAAV